MKIFVVIPLFNEEKHIITVVKDVLKYNLPVVVVDDGSADKSGFKIVTLRDKELRFKNLTLLEHKVNLGKGAAMKTGAEYAFGHGAEAVVFMDSDGQHKSHDLAGFIETIKSGKYDIVFGSRNFGMKMPFVRFLGNKIASLVMKILFGVYISDILCGFRGMTKNAYKKVKWDSTGYSVETEILARAAKTKLKFTEIPVETVYHDANKGVTMLDAFGVLMEVVKWRLTL